MTSLSRSCLKINRPDFSRRALLFIFDLNLIGRGRRIRHLFPLSSRGEALSKLYRLLEFPFKSVCHEPHDLSPGVKPAVICPADMSVIRPPEPRQGLQA